MVFDGIYFNDNWIKGISLEHFLDHEKHTMPEEKLKEVYQLIHQYGDSQKPIQPVKATRRKSNRS